MSLSPGQRLGPYEILSPAGAGGMGEVYRARDTRLDRLVAVKVLPSHLSVSDEARQRFDREARAISSLNHPHICALYDVGRQENVDFLVMEYLEGETLQTRLQRGPLPTDELLRVAVQVADALEKAHRQGLVHRDLKPGNLMLTRSGAKLMDFGVVKNLERTAPSSSLTLAPTSTSPLTAQGTVVGTFQYMAPEQLESNQVDARSDLFAFGAVLYEMATGQKAFGGKNQASLIAAILKDEPHSMSELQPLSPPALERLVRTCLAKDPEERWQSAGDLRRELQWIAEAGSRAGVPAPLATRRMSQEKIAWTLVAVLALTAILVAVTGTGLRSKSEGPLLRLSVTPPEGARFNLSGDAGGPPALSADGKRLAFSAISDRGGNQVYVRPLDSLAAHPIPGTEGASFPFWSPDGKSVAFFADGKLKRVDLEGTGTAFTLCDAPSSRGGTWGQGGIILFTPTFQSSLYQVPAGGGTPRVVTRLERGKHTTHRWPQFLPGGRRFIYFAASHEKLDSPDNGIYLASLDGEENRQILKTPSGAQYASGYLLFVQGTTLVAQPFDLASGDLKGAPVPTSENARLDTTTWRANFSASENGVLAYEVGGEASGGQVLWFDRSGQVVGSVGSRGSHLEIRLSPDGKRLAVETQEVPNSDLWIFDLSRNARTRFTFNIADESFPVWSPDGSRILFGSAKGDGRYRIYEKSSVGGGEERLILEMDRDLVPMDWSSDGRFVLFVKGDFGIRATADLWVLPMIGDRKPFPFLATEFEETDAVFSPDERYVAYASDESGREEVYVAVFHRPGDGSAASRGAMEGIGGKWQVSAAGGSLPRWRRDGRELYYRKADNTTVVAVPVESQGGTLGIGSEHPILQAYQAREFWSYDATADGKRFVVNSQGEESAKPIAIVLNWPAALTRK